MTRRLPAFRPSRTFTYAYLAAASVFASVTFSDDWHAVINDGVGTTALSVVSGILIGTILIATRRLGR